MSAHRFRATALAAAAAAAAGAVVAPAASAEKRWLYHVKATGSPAASLSLADGRRLSGSIDLPGRCGSRRWYGSAVFDATVRNGRFRFREVSYNTYRQWIKIVVTGRLTAGGRRVSGTASASRGGPGQVPCRTGTHRWSARAWSPATWTGTIGGGAPLRLELGVLGPGGSDREAAITGMSVGTVETRCEDGTALPIAIPPLSGTATFSMHEKDWRGYADFDTPADLAIDGESVAIGFEEATISTRQLSGTLRVGTIRRVPTGTVNEYGEPEEIGIACSSSLRFTARPR